MSWFLSWRDVRSLPSGKLDTVDINALYRVGDQFYRAYRVLSASNCCLCCFRSKCDRVCPDDIFFRPANELIDSGDIIE